LKEQSRGDPAKVAMAGRLRRETTLTVRQIAQRPGKLEKPQPQALPARQSRPLGSGEQPDEEKKSGTAVFLPVDTRPKG
jgi:hypothetical protein